MPKSWEHIQSCAGKYLTICSLKKKIYFQFSSLAQLCPLFATPWTTASQISLSITNSPSLFKLMSIKLVMPSNHLILCCPLLLSSVFPNIRVFSIESVLHIRWPKYWSFSFSISCSNEYSGLIFFRINWFELLAVQRDSHKSSLTAQFERINSSALSLLYVQHPYMNDYWKTHTDFRWQSVVSVF